MKWLICLLALFIAICNAQPVPRLPFPWPFCASTTTFTLGGTYTVTSTSTITSGTSTVTVTAPPSISISTSSTTIYTPTEISCLSTATTFSAYPAPFGTLQVRDPAPQITIPPLLPTGCPTASAVTIIPPSVSNDPCTRLEGDFAVTTETWVQPTPTSYDGLNYYQYINGYNYNSDRTGLGGGGYTTSDWSSNSSYYTSGLTRNINFESPDWPTGPAVCQLPGQESATDCSQWTVVFQGFLFGARGGTYTVHSPTVAESENWQDNSGFWWGGEKAYSSFEDGNVDGAATPLAVEGVSNSFPYELVAGEFLPMTFIYSNGRGPAANRIDITGPEGVRYPDDLDLFVPPCVDSPFVP
ncbi:hypothetical protein BDW62DRAFT_202630 [Aspergillus aurantiobrunneus]